MLLIVALVAMPLVLAACNTVKGFGKDITYFGERGEEIVSGKRGGTEPKR
jgi:predicted small secreted protein